MNTTTGGPDPHGVGTAALASVAGRPGRTPRPGAPRLGTILALATADARLLLRSRLVPAGLVAGAAILWAIAHAEQPLWWSVSWEIGYGQVLVAMVVLVTAQLAAGRPKRSALSDLYDSFPATAAMRTLGQLIGLAGALPASLLLIGGTAAAVAIANPVGNPNAWALAGGLLLVIAAGAAGIAIGTWFPHPLAGVLGAIVLFIPFSQSNRFSGPLIWLAPWMKPPQLDFLPGPLAGYPPVGAHAAELAGLAALAGVAALAATTTGTRARVVLALAGTLGLAATCLAGAAQVQPIPTADLNRLVQAVTDPASAQSCMSVGEGRYCLYPGFGPELGAIESPVSGVLTRLPVRPAQPLTVRQVAPLTPDTTLTHGHPAGQVSQWNAQLAQAPGNGGGSASAIYLPITILPSEARLYLALSAGEWAVHLPPANPDGNGLPCLPVNQAREAIGIWLALMATGSHGGQLQAGPRGQLNWFPVSPEGALVPIWNYPGQSLGYLGLLGPNPTAAGYLLASAMTNLPEQKVGQVLQAGWARWLNWRTTDSQLAAALGISMPPIPQFPGQAPPGNSALSPVCTA